MPKSRLRRTKDAGYTAPRGTRPKSAKIAGRWVVPTMVGLLCVGLAWLVVWYVAGNDIPLMSSLHAWNLLIGFAFIFAGLMVSTRWR